MTVDEDSMSIQHNIKFFHPNSIHWRTANFIVVRPQKCTRQTPNINPLFQLLFLFNSIQRYFLQPFFSLWCKNIFISEIIKGNFVQLLLMNEVEKQQDGINIRDCISWMYIAMVWVNPFPFNPYNFVYCKKIYTNNSYWFFIIFFFVVCAKWSFFCLLFEILDENRHAEYEEGFFYVYVVSLIFFLLCKIIEEGLMNFAVNFYELLYFLTWVMDFYCPVGLFVDVRVILIDLHSYIHKNI